MLALVGRVRLEPTTFGQRVRRSTDRATEARSPTLALRRCTEAQGMSCTVLYDSPTSSCPSTFGIR